MNIRITPMPMNVQLMQSKNKQEQRAYEYSSPSFKAMTKAQFKGIDLAVIEKFKFPIEKFNVRADFLDWGKKLFDKLKLKRFGTDIDEIFEERENILDSWKSYLTSGNSEYNDPLKYLILSAITSDLSDGNDNLPPVLNPGVLAQTVSDLDGQLKANPKRQVNFLKMYTENLRLHYLDDSETKISEDTGWIVIPSESNDPTNFNRNVEMLKTLSHKNWCTKSYNAEPYLAKGDFHVYLEKGKPKIGIRFVNNRIAEIQGELNDSKIPVKYFDFIHEYVKDNGYKLSDKAEIEIFDGIEDAVVVKCEQAKKDLGDALELKDIDDAEKVLDYFKMKPKRIHVKDENGNLVPKLVLSYYLQPGHYVNANSIHNEDCFDFKFSDLGIDENELLKDVIRIEGDMILLNSNLTKLTSLEYIGGDAPFAGSQIADLGRLKTVEGRLELDYTNLKSLGSLEYVGDSLNLSQTKVSDLGALKDVNGKLTLNSNIESLADLENVSGDLIFNDASVSSLGNLKTIGGNVDFMNSKVEDLGALETIGGDANFEDTSITSLGKLKSIGGNANFTWSSIESTDNLKTIGGNAFFADTLDIELKNLKTIGGSADFKNSEIKSLGNLETIGKHVRFKESSVTDLGKLKSVGGKVYLEASMLNEKDFANIKTGLIKF